MRWLPVGISLYFGLVACGVTVEPLRTSNVLITPKDLPPKTDIITNRPQLNLIPRAIQTEQAGEAVYEQLEAYRQAGLKVITGGEDRRYRRLKRIFSEVHRKSHMSDEPLTAILVDTAMFQAYTKGGLDVIFYTGLTERLTDDELALVAGHEIAHIAAGHVAEQGSRDIVNTASFGRQAALAAFYSIDAEVEADRVGLVYAALAGYDIRAAAGLWDKLERYAGNTHFNLFVDTHPSHAARSQMLAVYSQQLAPALETIKTDADIDRLLKCNPLYCAEQ